MVERSLSMRQVRGSMPLSSNYSFSLPSQIMSINDLEQLNAIDENSEEDEEMYIPIPFRFHDLAQRGDAALLEEEIQKNNSRDYNPHVDLAIVVMR